MYLNPEPEPEPEPYQPKKACVICHDTFPPDQLNRYGECLECCDEIESRWGF